MLGDAERAQVVEKARPEAGGAGTGEGPGREGVESRAAAPGVECGAGEPGAPAPEGAGVGAVPGTGGAAGAWGCPEAGGVPEARSNPEPAVPAPRAPEPRAPEPRKPVRELTPRELGMKGEEMAAGYLERKDWEILARNWRCRFGEVDIVAREAGDDETVVLVEVKTRLALGERASEMPELAVDAKKRRRYRNLALAYVVEHPDVDSIRFDVIALNVVGETQARLRHLRGAFGWDD